MDYLLLLVGKDQETIIEATKELAENSESKSYGKSNDSLHGNSVVNSSCLQQGQDMANSSQMMVNNR
jgi:hypothetical protein